MTTTNPSITLTHQGWFGLCPIHMTDPDDIDPDGPFIGPRHWALEPLFMLSEVIFDAVFFVKGLTDPEFEPFWPLTGVLPLEKPITVESEAL